MPAREIFDVVIVGFGPAGATCANLLGRYGLRTLAILPHTASYTPSEYYGAGGQLIKRLANFAPRFKTIR